MYDNLKVIIIINLFHVSYSFPIACLLNLKCATVDDIGQEKDMPLYIEHQEKLIDIGNDTFF